MLPQWRGLRWVPKSGARFPPTALAHPPGTYALKWERRRKWSAPVKIFLITSPPLKTKILFSWKWRWKDFSTNIWGDLLLRHNVSLTNDKDVPLNISAHCKIKRHQLKKATFSHWIPGRCQWNTQMIDLHFQSFSVKHNHNFYCWLNFFTFYWSVCIHRELHTIYSFQKNWK